MNKNLVWIDLEMTGLDPQQDQILEVACVVTNNNLDVIATMPSLLIKTPQKALDGMIPVVKELHTVSGLLKALHSATLSCAQVEQRVLAFVQQYCQSQTAPLCGNSVWMDKMFIKEHMPALYAYLHYRIIDVSTIKELVQRWYPHDQQATVSKKNSHRALEDIQESIAELRHYRKYFFKKVD